MSDERPIMILEDSPIDLDLTMLALQEASSPSRTIIIARDGEEAIEYIRNWRPDDPRPRLILLDLKLPKRSGFEVLESFRNHVALAMTPIVIMSSSGDASDIQIAYRLGANSYLVKPVNFDDYMQIGKRLQNYWFMLNQAPADIEPEG